MLPAVKIGILGGTGPAGSALAARLADAGYDVVVGSRSKYRAMEAVDTLLDAWPGKNLSIAAGANEDAADADIVVIATPVGRRHPDGGVGRASTCGARS